MSDDEASQSPWGDDVEYGSDDSATAELRRILNGRRRLSGGSWKRDTDTESEYDQGEVDTGEDFVADTKGTEDGPALVSTDVENTDSKPNTDIKTPKRRRKSRREGGASAGDTFKSSKLLDFIMGQRPAIATRSVPPSRIETDDGRSYILDPDTPQWALEFDDGKLILSSKSCKGPLTQRREKDGFGGEARVSRGFTVFESTSGDTVFQEQVTDKAPFILVLNKDHAEGKTSVKMPSVQSDSSIEAHSGVANSRRTFKLGTGLLRDSSEAKIAAATDVDQGDLETVVIGSGTKTQEGSSSTASQSPLSFRAVSYGGRKKPSVKPTITESPSTASHSFNSFAVLENLSEAHTGDEGGSDHDVDVNKAGE